jgi:tetraacyldisaccharide 4'-kinase
MWYEAHPLSTVLAPLGWLYGMVVTLRRYAYRAGLLRSEKLPVPVIVVGNITVGGTGKTPLVINLVKRLQQAGHRPGVVSRGYGGAATRWPQAVNSDSDPYLVGDEPVLIARRAACPVVVGPRRVRAAKRLLAEHDCDVIICDDGLQHYALARDIEIAVVDGARRFGNGRCLPAGPLRESPSRLQSADMVIVNGGGSADACSMRLMGEQARQLQAPGISHALRDWNGKSVHGVAGIGNPARFFAHLRAHGHLVVEHAFPDHHDFRMEDLHFDDDLPVMMTEKDAVKCRGFARPNHWYVPVDAQLDAQCEYRIQELLTRILTLPAGKVRTDTGTVQ